MEIKVYIDGSEFTDEAMRKAVEKAVTENMPKPKSVFERVEKRKKYLYSSAKGDVDFHLEDGDRTDDAHYSSANYFTDTPEGRAVAHQFAMHQELWRKLTKFAMENGGVAGETEEHYRIAGMVAGSEKFKVHHSVESCFGIFDVRFRVKDDAQHAIIEVVKPYLAAHPDFEW